MIKVSRDKNWDEVKARLNSLKQRGGLAAAQVLKHVGLKGEEIIVNHIVNQDLGWKDLSPLYKLSKERKFAEKAKKAGKKKRSVPTQKILVDTSTLFQSITSFAKKKKVYVGVPAGDKYTEDSKSVAHVAAVHEYGSVAKNVPARPLFTPSRDELKKWCEDNVKLMNIFISKLQNNE